MSSPKLFLLARGKAVGGVTIRQSGEGDVAKVKIVAQYRNFEALEEVEVCAVNRGEGDNGVGIFGPVAPHGYTLGYAVSFVVYLDLPLPKDESVLTVKSLETDMPMFAQHVGDLQNGVHFDSISLETANAPISVKSLHATKARSETFNAPISGGFNVSSSLTLVTSNDKIDVTADLYNDKETKGPTDLKLDTSNGPIKANLNLISPEDIGSAFSVDACTSNAGLDLTFLSAPVDSVLSVTASTSLGPARVNLHETHKGASNLKTSLDIGHFNPPPLHRRPFPPFQCGPPPPFHPAIPPIDHCGPCRTRAPPLPQISQPTPSTTKDRLVSVRDTLLRLMNR